MIHLVQYQFIQKKDRKKKTPLKNLIRSIHSMSIFRFRNKPKKKLKRKLTFPYPNIPTTEKKLWKIDKLKKKNREIFNLNVISSKLRHILLLQKFNQIDR